MKAAFGNIDDITTLHRFAFTAEHNFTLAVDECPHLIPIGVPLIAYRTSCTQFKLFCQGAESVREFDIVYYLVLTPTPFFLHRTFADAFNEMLQVFALLAIRDKYAVGRCRYDEPFCSDTYNGLFKLVYYIAAFCGILMNITE